MEHAVGMDQGAYVLLCSIYALKLIVMTYCVLFLLDMSGYTAHPAGLRLHPSIRNPAVRNIVVDSRQLASLGTEERTVTRGDSVLGPDQRSLIARCPIMFTPCETSLHTSSLYCYGSNAVVSRLLQLRQHRLDTQSFLCTLGKHSSCNACRCDMLFLGTSFMGVSEGADGMNGCDCNDRGGPPGFVQARDCCLALM